jgi:outer membrane protein
LTTSTAFADTIANRFGITGRVGAVVPFENDFVEDASDTDSALAWNGGFIYGFTDHIATELEVTYIPEMDVERKGYAYEAEMTDLSIGLQYRFMPEKSLVPFIGIGADFIEGNLKPDKGSSYDMDWSYGGHVNAGLDWFLTKGIALTADMRLTAADSGDIDDAATQLEYDPLWFQGTVGFRLILPEKW